MARDMERLHSTDIRRLGKGRYGDGGGLWLHVNDDGRYWFFRWGAGGKHTLSLGPTHTISLSKAREKARACRELLLDGRDPKAEAIAQRVAAKLKAQQPTFSQAADQYFNLNGAKWRSAKHAAEWRSSLKLYAEPVFGSLPVDSVTTTLVLQALEPIWTSKTPTAARVRQRIETVLDFSKARGFRSSSDNPARWRGHLDQVLPRPRQIAPVVHHAALSYREIPALMRKLVTEPGVAARCLEFVILNAVRTNEARRATWNEIDADVWTVPPARMKRAKPHRVPLSTATRALLMRLRRDDSGGFIFSGRLQGRPFGVVALSKLTKRLGADAALTVHGFRSSFRDWAAEQTSFPREVAEIALAHAIGSETERSYQRGDLLEQRRKLMEKWAAFCSAGESTDNILPIARRRG
jgi:integrase